MRSCTFRLLVCFVFLVAACAVASAKSQDFIHVNILTPENPAGSALLRTPTLNGISQDQAVYRQASASYYGSAFAPPSRGKPIAKCKAPVCAPPPCAPVCKTCCVLPLRMPGQFELSTQVFFPHVRGTFQWPGTVLGVQASEVAFSDVGIPSHATLLEYSAKYQIAPRWALYYSIMPIELSGTKVAEKSFWFGQWFYPIGTQVHGKWQFTYQRVGLMFQPILNPAAAVSFYAGWTFNEQRLSINSSICGGNGSTIDRTRNMVNTGIEIQRCLRTLPNGSTFACDNKAEVIWLDGAFGYDIQAGMRFSVPLGYGRWGYAKGGYRLLNFNEDRDDLRLDSSFEGGFVEGGIIF